MTRLSWLNNTMVTLVSGLTRVAGVTRVARMSDKDGRPGWCVARFNCCESLQLLHQAEAEGRAGVRFHLYSANVLLRRSINCS